MSRFKTAIVFFLFMIQINSTYAEKYVGNIKSYAVSDREMYDSV